MKENVRILIVEDASADAELAQREIGKSIKECKFQRVETQKEYLKALKTFQPDIILSDYSLPRFNGMKALELALEHAPLTPLIVWTGSLSEDVAVECMKAGANNYILKENIQRLGPAVVHALEERQLLLERKQAEEKYQVIFENSPVGIFQSTPDGRFISVNPAMALIYGYDSPEEMIDSITNIAKQIYPEPNDRKTFVKLFDTQDVVTNYELENLRKDGTIFWTSTSARAVRDANGRIHHYEGFLQDITDRKQAEKAVKESEDRFRALIENGRDNISLLDGNGNLLWESPATFHTLGYEMNEFKGRSIFDLMHPNDLDWTRTLFGQLIQEAGSRKDGIFRLRHATGTWRWMEATATNMLDNPNVQAIVINYRDITERKQAEDAVRESEERFSKAFNLGPAALSISQRDGGIFLAVNEAYRNLYGYEDDEIVGHTPFDLHMYPDENELSQFMELLHQQKSFKDLEFRTQTKTGEIRIVLCSGESIELGGEKYMLSFTTDITERREAEKQLAYQAQLLSNVNDAVLAFDKDFVLTSWNKAAERLYGWTEEEVTGKLAYEILATEFFDTTQEEAIQQLRSTGESHAEVIHTSKDGRKIYIDAQTTSLRDQNGELAYVAVNRDITNRKQTEEAIRESEARYRGIFEGVQDAILVESLDGDILDVNKRACEIFGYSHDEFITKKAIDLVPSEEYFIGVPEIWADSGWRSFETIDVRVNGEQFPVEVRGGLYEFGEQKVCLVVLHDITERKKAELDRSVLTEIMQAGASTSDLYEFLKLIHASVGKMIYAENFFVAYYEPITGLFEELYSVDQYDPPAPPAKLEKSITSYVYRTGKPIIMTQSMFDELVASGEVELVGTNSPSWMGVPLKTPNGTIGVIAVQDYETPNRYSERDRDFLTSIASQVALVIERIQAEKAEREQRALAEALRDTAETLSSTLDYGEVLDHILAAVGRVVPHDAATIMLIENSKAHVVRTQGYEERGFNAEVMEVELSLKDTGNLRQMFETGQPVVIPETKADPNWKGLPATEWLYSNVGAPISIYGEVIGFILLDSETSEFFTTVHAERLKAFANQAAIAIHNARLLEQAQDEISERKQAEANLLQSQQDLAEAQRIAQIGSWRYQSEGETIQWSDELYNIFGVEKEHFDHVYDGFLKLIHPDDRERVRQINANTLSSGKSFALEYRIITPAGKEKTISEMGYAVKDESGQITGLFGTAQDITERKHTEEARRESEERFLQLAENIREAFWLTDAVTGEEIYISPAAEKIWGRPLKNLMNEPEAFLSYVLPQDRPKVKQVLNEQRGGKNIEVEYRVSHPDGSVHWVWDRAFPIVDDTGQVKRVAGIAADITERKQFEDALQASEERFHSLFDRMLDGVYRSTHEGRFEDVNPAMVKMFGYASREEMLNVDIKNELYFSPNERGSHVLDTGREETDIYRMRRKDGSEIWVEDHGSYIHDENGNVLYHEGILRDITERKQSEEILRARDELLQEVQKISRLGHYTLNIVNGIWESSETLSEIFGIEESYSTDIEGWLSLVHPAQQEEMNEYFHKTILEEHHPFDREYRIIRKNDAQERWVHGLGRLEFDDRGNPIRMIGTIQDITERKQTEEALRQSEERYRQLLEVAPIGVGVHIEGKLVFANEAAARIVGAEMPEELVGLPVMNFVHPEEREETIATLRRALKGETGLYPREERFVRLDGSIINVEVVAVPLTYFNKSAVQVIIQDITERKQTEKELQRHLAEMEAVYENGLALSQLLEPQEIGERVINTFAQHLLWHHVTIRLIKGANNDELELVAFSLPHMLDEDKKRVEQNFASHVSKIGQGLSGWVAQTGKSIRTGKVRDFPQYANTYDDIQSGLYMPLMIGEHVIGVISVESEEKDAFSMQDERLLATLASQAAIAFENTRLYEYIQDERKRFANLFENSPIATWLEDFSEVVTWLEGLKAQGVNQLSAFLKENPEEFERGVSLIRILDVNHAAVISNGARNKQELIEQVHNLMIDEMSRSFMIREFEMLWNGFTTFEFEMSSKRLDDSVITAIQRIFIPVSGNGKADYGSVILTSTDISDRVKMEKALRASETHYRELADSITDVFFELNQDMRYTHWNKASEALTGISAKKAMGKKMRDIFGESDEQNRIGNIYEDVFTTHKPRSFETILNVNNEQRSFDINAYPSTRGVAVVAKDVTERKRSEIIMQKRYELMEYSAKHLLDEVMQKTIDEVSNLTGSEIGFFHFIESNQNELSTQTWSTNALKVSKVPVSDGTHRPVNQAGVWAEAVRQRRSLIHNDYESLQEKKGFPEGHVQIERMMVVPIIRNEIIVAVMGIANKAQDYTQHDLETAERFADYAWDITERKQMEKALADERNQLAKRVEERTAELARALRVKDEFLANMSHELRTPLNAILGLSESLAEQVAGTLNEKQSKYINTISESGHHLLSLINDILDLAKIEAGQITLDINKVDVNNVCQTSLRMVKQLAQKKNQDINLHIDEGIGLIWADERRLKQMLVNLLSNAVKFTPENGKIGLEVHGRQEENKVELIVWDNGIGINQYDLPRLFHSFVQLDSGLARESTGTGLGLALVAQMARLHGGSVTATSEPNKGSRFTITLPWEPALVVDTVEKLRNTGQLGMKKKNLKGKRTVLLIEDTTEVIMMLKDYLESSEYSVVTAQDGIDGIAEATRSHPDLILMDIQMPRMDGIEATKKLRSMPEFQYTPIIALTALAMPNDRERCLEAGMNEYISKPVNLRALAKIIQGYLSTGEEQTKP